MVTGSPELSVSPLSHLLASSPDAASWAVVSGAAAVRLPPPDEQPAADAATGIVALVMLLTGAEGGIWLAIIPVALANGIGILALGTWLGGKLMDARMLSIVAALDSFASLQK